LTVIHQVRHLITYAQVALHGLLYVFPLVVQTGLKILGQLHFFLQGHSPSHSTKVLDLKYL